MPRPGPRSLLVLLWDELKRDTLRLYGGPVATPGCECLAARGVTFDRLYCATPLCVPTRPSMMGGRWPHAHGAVSFGKSHELLNPGEQLLFDRLLDAGYHVGYEGIWHINRRPEDDRSGEMAYFKPTGFCREQYRQVLAEQGRIDSDAFGTCTYLTENGVVDARLSVPLPARWKGPIEDHLDYQHADNIAQFIRGAPEDRPFAAFCSLGVPHPPLLVPDRFMDSFDPARIAPPPGFGMDRTELPRAVAQAPGYQAVADWGWDRWAEAIAAYYGFVAFGDACLRVVLDALEQSGRADDTIILMTSDHGEMLGSHTMYQKGCMYNDAIRLACVMAGPGIADGRRGQLASQTDLAPTLLELLGLPALPDAQGVSLVSVLEDETAPGHPYTFSEFNGHLDGGYSIRCCVSQTHKYVYYHGDGTEQLFDLVTDPSELTNVAGDPAYAEVRARMRSAMAAWMEQTGDFIKAQWPG